MVTITDYQVQKDADGKTKIYLHLSGELVPQVSSTSGKTYLRPLKTKVFAAIDEEHAEQLIGVDINGCIKRVEVEPYEVVNYRTGEIQVFNYKNVFVSPNKSI
jgi:hypothetical protein